MTDGKRLSQSKQVPTPQELDDMPEGGTPDSAGSSKGKATGSKKKRNTMRVRESVGRSKKVVKAPRTKPKPDPASNPEKSETSAKRSSSTSSRTRVTSVKVKKTTSRRPRKPPVPESPESSGGGGRYTPPPPQTTPPASEPSKPSKKPTPDEKAREMARREAEKRGHQIGDFEPCTNPVGRNRTHESRCVNCEQRVIAMVVFYENFSENFYDIRAGGKAVEGSCSYEPRRRSVAKTEQKSQPKPKSGKQEKLPGSFEVPLPSWDVILEATAQDEARRAANDRDRRHRVKVLFPISYPEAGKDSIYQGKCEKCRRKVFGKVQRFPGEPGKSERILVYGNALQYPCSGARAKR